MTFIKYEVSNDDVMVMSSDVAYRLNRKILIKNGYRLVPRATFDNRKNLPHGLKSRADSIIGKYVVYDPEDDEDGWLLIGDDPHTLAAETIRNRCS